MEIHLRQSYSFIQLGQRDNQEDARYPDIDNPHDSQAVFVVCDGVGGEAKGEVASRIVADSIGNEMIRYDLKSHFTARQFSKVLEKVYSDLKKASDSSNGGMATTMTFACVHSGGIFTAYIGDSRIYHVRPGVGILYQSEDHSLVNALVHSGNLTPEEAIDHPQNNIITRCLSPLKNNARMETATTYQITDVEAGDYIFMCSDGVLHEIDDATLEQILESDVSDEEKMKTIARLSRHSADNNTAYLIGIEEVVYDEDDLSGDSDEEDGAGGFTRSLPINNETTIETESKHQKSVGSQISDFFNKLF